MKLQDLNRSFGKTLAAVAIAFIISSAAQAQQGQWGRDGCFYVPAYRQMVRQGCAFQVAGGHQFYQNYGTKVVTDLNTGISYFLAQNGRWLVSTRNGWAYLAVRSQTPASGPSYTTQPAQTLKPGEIAPGVRENIPQDASLMTPEEKAWVQKSNGQMLGIMTGQTQQTHCENGGGLNGTRYNDTLLGPQQKQCTYP